jgi:hypothetical protein
VRRIAFLSTACLVALVAATVACAGGSARPRNDAAPTLAGSAQVGRTLTASPGAWTGAQPMAFTYRWSRCHAGGRHCSTIGSATTPTYTVTADDAGSVLVATVTASNGGGSRSASTSATALVPAQPGAYPWHTQVVATTFWVGEIFNGSIADGSQVCSAYDSEWANHWSGVRTGTAGGGTDCAGAPTGGCDGVPSGSGPSFTCATEARAAANDYFPTDAHVHPHENPFYLDLPFDDVNDRTAFRERCNVIPWANDPGFAGHCSDQSFSYMKNRWVRIVGPNGHSCYGQIEDAGPSHGNLYHDARYVFGASDARPVQGQFNDAGLDVSPALNGCLGFAELDGEDDHVDWQFVDDADVPAGPWTRIVTTRGVG